MKEFLVVAEAEVRSLTSLYSGVVCFEIAAYLCSHFNKKQVFFGLDEFLVVMQGRNADALALYFGEDPARCPFEQGNFD